MCFYPVLTCWSAYYLFSCCCSYAFARGLPADDFFDVFWTCYRTSVATFTKQIYFYLPLLLVLLLFLNKRENSFSP